MKQNAFLSDFPVIGHEFSTGSFDAVLIDPDEEVYNLVINLFTTDKEDELDGGMVFITAVLGSLQELVSVVGFIINSNLFACDFFYTGNLMDSDMNIIREIDWEEMSALDLFEPKETKTIH